MQANMYWQKLEYPFLISRKVSTPPELRPHIHDAYEIMLILSEGIFCEINNQLYSAPSSSLILFNNMDLHQIITPENGSYDRYVVYFEPEFVAHLSTMQAQLLECFYRRPFDNPWILPLNAENCQQLQVLLDRTLAAQQESANAYGHELLLQLQMAELLIFVNRLYREQHGILNKSLDASPFFEMLNYIHQHLGEKLTLESMEKQFYIPKKDISNLFYKVTGASLGEYITKCRLSKATDALVQGMRVEAVCEMVGFQNLSHFSRTFKKYMGCSPKQYAIRHLQ